MNNTNKKPAFPSIGRDDLQPIFEPSHSSTSSGSLVGPNHSLFAGRTPLQKVPFAPRFDPYEPVNINNGSTSTNVFSLEPIPAIVYSPTCIYCQLSNTVACNGIIRFCNNCLVNFMPNRANNV